MKIRTVCRDKAFSGRTLFLRSQIIMLLLALLPALAAGQLVYDSVRVKVAPGVTCPAAWTASTESVTTPTRYIVQAPPILGGRGFRVTLRFADAVWPTAANKSAAVASGVLVIEAGSTAAVNYCDLLP